MIIIYSFRDTNIHASKLKNYVFIYFSFVLEKVQAVLTVHMPPQYTLQIHGVGQIVGDRNDKSVRHGIRFVCSGLRKMNRNRKEANFKSVIDARFKHLCTFSISIARGCGTVSFVITGLLLGHYLARESNGANCT